MKSKKRLIDANALMTFVAGYVDEPDYQHTGEDWRNGAWAVGYEISTAPTEDAVPVDQFNALKNLVNGEWVDCEIVQEALGIDFSTGFKMFDFSRTAEWNPAPLNGQKITTKFRLKNAAKVVHGRWEIEGDDDNLGCSYFCSNCQDSFDEDWFYVTGKYRHFNYCPNCGAKMDGGDPSLD